MFNLCQSPWNSQWWKLKINLVLNTVLRFKLRQLLRQLQIWTNGQNISHQNQLVLQFYMQPFLQINSVMEWLSYLSLCTCAYYAWHEQKWVWLNLCFEKWYVVLKNITVNHPTDECWEKGTEHKQVCFNGTIFLLEVSKIRTGQVSNWGWAVEHKAHAEKKNPKIDLAFLAWLCLIDSSFWLH